MATYLATFKNQLGGPDLARLVRYLDDLAQVQWIVWAFASLTPHQYDDGLSPDAIENAAQARMWRPLLSGPALATMLSRAVNIYDETILIGNTKPTTMICPDNNSYWSQCEFGIELIDEWRFYFRDPRCIKFLEEMDATTIVVSEELRSSAATE